MNTWNSYNYLTITIRYNCFHFLYVIPNLDKHRHSECLHTLPNHLYLMAFSTYVRSPCGKCLVCKGPGTAERCGEGVETLNGARSLVSNWRKKQMNTLGEGGGSRVFIGAKKNRKTFSVGGGRGDLVRREKHFNPNYY